VLPELEAFLICFCGDGVSCGGYGVVPYSAGFVYLFNDSIFIFAVRKPAYFGRYPWARYRVYVPLKAR
jgi:hypothetical protein